MIERIRIQNYKALRDVTLDLTPMHVLIGPNDTGKTSILEAITALCRSVDHEMSRAFVGRWEGTTLVWHGASERTVTLSADIAELGRHIHYELECEFGSEGRNCWVKYDRALENSVELFVTRQRQGATTLYRSSSTHAHRQKFAAEIITNAELIAHAMKGVSSCRWDPRMLALPVAASPDRRLVLDPSGFGLALLLDDILGFDRERFNALESRYRKVFPQVRSIKLKRERAFTSPHDNPENVPILHQGEGKGIHFEFDQNGHEVPAAQASDGLLIVLAYLATVFSPNPPRVVLVEEPENGIHPERLGEVISIVRELISEHPQTQVVMTTHSPYVLDQFKPQDVTLCTRGDDGAVSVHRLSESTAVQKQINLFTLGEIWTGEGDDALAKPSTSSEGPSQ